MKTLFTQFEKAAEDVQLSKTEKNRMREQLISYMEYKPIRKSEKKSPATKKTPFALFPFFQTHHFTGALLIAVLITTSTFGVTFAADDALPGDLLYDIKVNVNEEIKSALLFSSQESRIEWKKERAERRLEEASQLAAEGRLDEKNTEKVSRLFAEHTEEMVQEVRAAEVENPVLAAEASSEFEGSLDTHEAVLARLIVEQEGEVNEDSRGLVEQVRTAAMEVEKIREEAETKITHDTSASEEEDASGVTISETSEEMVESANLRIRAAQHAKVRAEELHQAVQEAAEKLEKDSERAQQTQAQIEYGEAKLEAGNQAFIDSEYNTAYNAFREAAISFQKVTQLLAVAELFSIEIYTENATETEEDGLLDSDDTISEEKRAQIEMARTEAKNAIESARSLLLTQSGFDAETIENAHKKVKDAGAYVLRGEISMVLNDYNNAKHLFERAYSFAMEAVENLTEESESDDVQNVTSTENSEPTIPQTPTEDTDSNEKKSVGDTQESLTFTETYRKGVHSYVTTVEVPTPCYGVEYTAAVAESYPEQVSVAIITIPPTEGVDCVQVLDKKELTVQFSASEEAKLVDVTLNGEKVEWEVVQTGDETQTETMQEGGEATQEE